LETPKKSTPALLSSGESSDDDIPDLVSDSSDDGDSSDEEDRSVKYLRRSTSKCLNEGHDIIRPQPIPTVIRVVPVVEQSIPCDGCGVNHTISMLGQEVDNTWVIKDAPPQCFHASDPIIRGPPGMRPPPSLMVPRPPPLPPPPPPITPPLQRGSKGFSRSGRDRGGGVLTLLLIPIAKGIYDNYRMFSG